MARLNLEEKGLLQVLERIERGEAMMAPSIRYGLIREGLIEGDPPALSPLGERVLEELRLRAVRLTGEFPTFALPAIVKSEKS
jgi:hypothetical protein